MIIFSYFIFTKWQKYFCSITSNSNSNRRNNSSDDDDDNNKESHNVNAMENQ